MGRSPKRGVARERKGRVPTRRAGQTRKASRTPDVWAAQRAMGNRAVEGLVGNEHHELRNPPAIVDAAIARGAGHALDESTRQTMEARFGQDLKDVRVHTDPMAADSARASEARAYTAGEDIVFGAGQYAPGNAEGRELLAHELTHVVDARRGEGTPGAIQRAPLPGAGERLRLLSSDIPAPVVTRFPGAIVATLYFGHNLFLLDAANFDAVEKLSDELRFMLDPSITVDGYASQEGTVDENLKLSARRREQVIRLLTAKATGKPTVGGTAHGGSEPAEEEKGAKPELERQRARNRRVTIVIPLPAASPGAPEPTKKIDIDLHDKPRPETDEERSDRQIREALHTKIPAAPKTSLTKEFWKVVDEAVDSASRRLGIPEKYRGKIRDGAHAAIEKGAEAGLDEALGAAGANDTQKKALKAAINQAAGTEL